MANALGFTRIYNGLTIKLSSNTPSGQGDIVSDSSTGNLLYHNGTTSAALASASNTITLTNKSIDASANTLTNIANAAIAAGAAIAYSKLNLAGSIVNADIATGAAIAYTKLNLATSIVNADISASAAIAYSKLSLAGSILNADIASGAAIALSKLAALSTSKIAATDGSGVLTTTNGVVPVTAKGDLIVGSGAATASTLTVGADGTTPVADSGATTGIRWATQQQGNKNYITYNNFENGATTGWTLCNVGTLTNGLPTGTSPNFSFASGNLAISVVSSGQLAGTKSLQALMTAASTVGDGIATQAYTIDAEDQAKCLGFRFAYKASANASNANFSGTSSNSFGVAVWDATNSVFIPVPGAFNLIQSSGVGIATGTFQTASNTASIRFVIYNVTATAGAVTMLYDDFFVGPQITSMGPAMSDWVAYTPTFVGLGTPTGVTFESRRVGDTLEVKGLFTSGTVSASTVQIGIGYNGGSGNVVVDTSKISGNTLVGNAGTAAAGATYFDNAILAPPSNASYVQFGQQSSTVNKLSPGTGNNIGTGTNVQLYFAVPIVGWSSNTVQSADTDSRVIAMEATSASGTISGSGSTVTWGTVVKDTAGSMGSTTYTIPVSGYYNIAAQVGFNQNWTSGVNAQVMIINVTTSATIASNQFLLQATIAGGVVVPCSINGVYLTAGTQINVQGNSGGTGGSYFSTNNVSYFSVTRCSGPAVVQATESVNGRYYNTASSLSGTAATITYSTKDFDTHNAYSGGTLTIPVSGKYQFNVGLATTGTFSVTQVALLGIYRDGTEVSEQVFVAGGAVSFGPIEVSDIISCSAGAQITIKALSQATSPATQSNTVRNYFSWARVGN